VSAAALSPIPSRPAACHTSTGSPTGSAAATSNSRWVSAESPASLRRKLSSIRPDSPGASSRPNPPASSAGVNPRGNSSNASGLPRVSATSRSRTRSSNGTPSTEPNKARASPFRRPSTGSFGSPLSSSLGSRVTNTSATDSASSPRATNTSAWAEARSSHCASSTTHRSGRSSATSANRLSTANPTRNRSGASPAGNPNATPSACCLGGRQPIQAIQQRHTQALQRPALNAPAVQHLRRPLGDHATPTIPRPRPPPTTSTPGHGIRIQ
jgi:hypothetical protein